MLDEAFTLLFRRLAIHKAKESLEFLMTAASEEAVLLAPIHAARFREAVKLRVKDKDKPEISFTDFTSMVVMQELELKRILTEDRHFAQVGLGFGSVLIWKRRGTVARSQSHGPRGVLRLTEPRSLN